MIFFVIEVAKIVRWRKKREEKKREKTGGIGKIFIPKASENLAQNFSRQSHYANHHRRKIQESCPQEHWEIRTDGVGMTGCER